jgi:uncharacterized protein YdeI (YjbR/CyaY-like superfamily)
LKATFFIDPGAFRGWLEEHHAVKAELVVGFYKRGTGRPSITWPESVDEALCFGWIDGVRRRLDAEAYCIRFTPRRSTSIWSAVNVARVAELQKRGRMHPAGERAFAARTPERTGIYSFERHRAAKLSRADAARFRKDARAFAFFEAQPPWYRRTALHWVVSAKREETRQRRLDRLISDSAAGRTIGPLRRPAPQRPSPRAARRRR